jgi:hypothetical protein
MKKVWQVQTVQGAAENDKQYVLISRSTMTLMLMTLTLNEDARCCSQNVCLLHSRRAPCCLKSIMHATMRVGAYKQVLQDVVTAE